MIPDADRPADQGPDATGPAAEETGSEETGSPAAAPSGRRRRHRRVVRPGREQPMLSPTSDDVGVGWGEHPDPDDGERLRREVPPHWGKD